MNDTLVEESQKLKANINRKEDFFDKIFEELNISNKPKKNILDLVGKNLFDQDYNYKSHRV